MANQTGPEDPVQAAVWRPERAERDRERRAVPRVAQVPQEPPQANPELLVDDKRR
ncbi:MAG: hypothetical protein Q8927_02450 [Bacteroidota bacterium]|nr:hypothetical protein [Bacteroidota bacterium]